MVVPVNLRPMLSFGEPRVLIDGFNIGGNRFSSSTRYDVTPDRKRFLVNVLTEETPLSGSRSLTFVENWTGGVHTQ